MIQQFIQIFKFFNQKNMEKGLKVILIEMKYL